MTMKTKRKREKLYQGTDEVVDKEFPYLKHYVEHYENLSQDFYDYIFNRKDGEEFCIEKLSQLTQPDPEDTVGEDVFCFGEILYSNLQMRVEDVFADFSNANLVRTKIKEEFSHYLDGFGYKCDLYGATLEKWNMKYKRDKTFR